MKTYMDSIFASVASGVITADTRGIVTTFNRAAERIFTLASQRAHRPAVPARAWPPLATSGWPSAMHRAHDEEQQVTLGYEVTRELPGRGEVALRLNVSPLRTVERRGRAARHGDGGGRPDRAAAQPAAHGRRFSASSAATFTRRSCGSCWPIPSAVTLGGETREVSVVFADMRGFTQLAEQLTPEETVRVLNQHLDLLTEAVWQYEGTITMFMGDAVMAIFNAPLAQPDHARRAVCAAWAMRVALDRYHARSRRPAIPPCSMALGCIPAWQWWATSARGAACRTTPRLVTR